MGRDVQTIYVYSCDSPPACGDVMRIPKGAEVLDRGMTHVPVASAVDADEVAQAHGWYFRGGRAICPRHVMEGGR